MDDDTQKLSCPPDVADLVPEALARELEVFPLECSEDVITFAVAAPLSGEAYDKLRFVLGREIREAVHPSNVIRNSLDGLFGDRPREEPSIFYWREWREILDDGTIVMKARGYDEFGGHWTGWAEIAPGDPDFELWTWILDREDCFNQIISGKDLEAIREEHQRTA